MKGWRSPIYSKFKMTKKETKKGEEDEQSETDEEGSASEPKDSD